MINNNRREREREIKFGLSIQILDFYLFILPPKGCGGDLQFKFCVCDLKSQKTHSPLIIYINLR